MAEYKDFVQTTGYKQPGGLCGFNCRHSFHPFDPRYDKPIYTSSQLETINDAEVTLPGGQKVKTYQASQMQREMERNLRRTKREREMAMVVKDTELTQKLGKKIRAQQHNLKMFCATTGLPRQYFRESVKG